MTISKDLEIDQQAKCKSYDRTWTYKQCVLTSLHNYYSDKIGCAPPWFTHNYNDVCNKTLTEADVKLLWYDVYKHIDLSEFGDCLKPCQRMHMQARLIG